MITDTCKCGATFVVKHKYWSEESTDHKKWLEAHSVCRSNKYRELIMAVAQKFPDESRHETALRYIRERENQCDGPCQTETP